MDSQKLEEALQKLSETINSEQFKTCLDQLRVSIAQMKRVTALMSMTHPYNPYRPLIRVMCKLDLIKDWPT